MSDEKTIGAGIFGLGVRGFYCIGMNLAQTCQKTGSGITGLCDRNPVRSEEVRDMLVGAYASNGGFDWHDQFEEVVRETNRVDVYYRPMRQMNDQWAWSSPIQVGAA